MLNQESIYVILFSLPIYQLLFYTVQLITFRKVSPSKRYLGYLLFLMTAFLIMNAAYYLGYDTIFSNLFFVFVPVLLSIAPVYFLYILSLTREDHDVTRNQKLFLFIPPFLVLLANIFVYGLLPAESRITFIHQGFTSAPTALQGLKLVAVVFWTGSIILLAGQLLLASWKVRKILYIEAAAMKQSPAYLAYLNWKWVITVSISAGIFLLINGLVDVFAPERSLGIAIAYNLFMLVTGGLTGYYGMKQNTLLLQVSKMTKPKKFGLSSSQVDEKDETSEPKATELMPPDEVDQVIKGLEQLMNREKPYLKPDFSMGDLCEMLGENRRKVTYVINEIMNKNFYGIVNDYRIREALNLLADQQVNNFKIDAIAEMVGFQSKSSFYACFKKYTGQTPTEYRATLSLGEADSD